MEGVGEGVDGEEVEVIRVESEEVEGEEVEGEEVESDEVGWMVRRWRVGVEDGEVGWRVGWRARWRVGVRRMKRWKRRVRIENEKVENGVGQ